jgi:hypothetical protein
MVAVKSYLLSFWFDLTSCSTFNLFGLAYDSSDHEKLRTNHLFDMSTHEAWMHDFIEVNM